MNSGLIKLITFLFIVFGSVYLFLGPFTKHQISDTVHTYFDYIQETKGESAALISTREQNDIDTQLMKEISLKYNGQYEFTNRSMKIVDNSLSDAVVEVTVVIKANVNGQIQTKPMNFKLQLKKALNVQGDKRWIITERSPS